MVKNELSKTKKQEIFTDFNNRLIKLNALGELKTKDIRHILRIALDFK